MVLNDHEMVLLARHYAEKAIKALDEGPRREEGGWVVMMSLVHDLLDRAAMFLEMNGDD